MLARVESALLSSQVTHYCKVCAMSVHFYRRLAGFAGTLIVLALAASLVACSTPISTPAPPETKASLINEGRDGLLVMLSAERSDKRGRASIGLPVQRSEEHTSE